MKKESALSLYASSPEEQSATQQYKDAQEALMNALTNRVQMFDPTLLAMAQGFLSPTKTGSFGETIGNVAAQVAPVQAAEEKRAQEIAKMRFEVAQQNLLQTRKGIATKMLQGAGGAGAPDGSGEGQISVGGQNFPASFSRMTPELALRISQIDPEQGKLAMDYLKLVESMTKVGQTGTVKITPQGVQYTPFGGKTTVERFVPGTGPIKMSEEDAIVFDKARDDLSKNPSDNKALQELYRIVDKSSQFPARPGVTPPVSAPAAPAAPAGLQTPAVSATPGATAAPAPVRAAPVASGGMGAPATQSEFEAQQKAKTARMEKEQLQRVDENKKWRDLGDAAEMRVPDITNTIDMLKGEGMNQVMGVLERPGVMTGLMAAAEQGVSLGRGFSISVPQVREIYTRNKISLPPIAGETKQQYNDRVQAVLDKTALIASRFAENTLSLRDLLKGGGSISNYEQGIAGSIAANTKDTVRSATAKLEHMKLHEETKVAIRDLMAATGKDYQDLKGTKEYKRLIQNFDSQLRSIYSGISADTGGGGWSVQR